MTKELNDEGYFILEKHTLTHLRFRNVENLTLAHFSHQNSIFELGFGTEPMSYPHGGGPAEGSPSNVITVSIDSSVGLQREFKYNSAKVTSAVPCDENGLASPGALAAS